MKKRKQLREIFWSETIQEVSVLVNSHAQRAKNALKKSTIIEDTTFLENLLEQPVKSAAKVLEEQKKCKSVFKVLSKVTDEF